jgi:hypothetical protein
VLVAEIERVDESDGVRAHASVQLQKLLLQEVQLRARHEAVLEIKQG